MVKRFDIVLQNADEYTTENDNGGWVKYEDYAKLANDFLFVAFGIKDAGENPVDDDTYDAASRFIDESKNN